MTWQSTTFERQTLYEEVWTEPMVSVAKRYGISDVGLRKICLKLAIPVPARGYWAKLEAGQKVIKEPLRASSVHPTFTRSVRIEKVDDVLERRVADAKASCPDSLPSTFKYEIPSDLSLRTREAKQIAAALKKMKVVDGVISLSGWAWADVSVSDTARQRALFLLDRFASAIRTIDGYFDIEQTQPSEQSYAQRRENEAKRGYFRLHGEKYFVRVKERVIKEEVVEPVPEKSARVGRPRRNLELSHSIFNPRKFQFMPSGRLQLSVFHVGSHYETQKTEDTSSSLVEDKLNSLLQRLEELSLRRKIELELQHEKELECQRKTKIWESQKVHKDALLRQLTTFETMAKNLDRAESLRRLAEKARNQSAVPAALSTSLELLTLMANWLDPLIAQHWPDVDDVPEKNPHRSWY